jgi:dihydrofolate reductase
MITLIAAIGANNEIGKDNSLLWHIPKEMKHFKNITQDKVVLMGYNTWLSIPDMYKPLVNRTNVVITTHLCPETISTFNNLDEALEKYEDVMVIGGASIYKQTIGRADKLIISHIDRIFPFATKYFPFIDKTQWHIESVTPFTESNDYSFNVIKYSR